MPHDPENCAQAPSIQKIEQLVSGMGEKLETAVERMEARDLMLIEALQGVADQNARINAQGEEIKHLRDENENLFDRMRSVETVIGPGGTTIDLKVEAVTRRQLFEIASSKPVLILSTCLTALVILGTLLDVFYHTKGVEAAWSVFNAIRN